MNQTDILKLAEYVGLKVIGTSIALRINGVGGHYVNGVGDVEITRIFSEFANLVAQHERKSCIKAAREAMKNFYDKNANLPVDYEDNPVSQFIYGNCNGTELVIRAIRARNESSQNENVS